MGPLATTAFWHRRLLAALSLAAIAANLSGQHATGHDAVSHGLPSDLPTAVPEAVGMSTERLGRIDDLVQGYIDDGLLAGTVTLVARKGKVVHLASHGHRHREADAPMTADTIFVIMSMTKPIASTALMMLFEEGHFLLDDPVSRWLPEFEGLPVGPAGEAGIAEASDGGPQRVRPITIRQALTHTTGLRSAPRGGGGARPTNVVESIARATAQPLAFEPGSRWSYGDSTDIVAALVEAISGESLDAFTRNRIFEPLGMADTHYNVPESKTDRKSAVYSPDPEQDFRIERRSAPRHMPPTTVFHGTYGLSSTAADYFRFLQMVLNGGELDGARILSPHTVNLMITNHIGDLPVSLKGPGYGFGLGYSVLLDAGRASEPLSPGTFGWGGAWNTYFFVDPDQELIGVFMSQLTSYRHLPVRPRFASLASQAIVELNREAPTIRGYHRR